jgi:hypothetical protein
VTDPGPGPLHLLTVWNPAYADSIMDAHLEVLLGWDERRERGEADDDRVYVWWTKLRSQNRQQPLPHLSGNLYFRDYPILLCPGVNFCHYGQ